MPLCHVSISARSPTDLGPVNTTPDSFPADSRTGSETNITAVHTIPDSFVSDVLLFTLLRYIHVLVRIKKCIKLLLKTQLTEVQESTDRDPEQYLTGFMFSNECKGDPMSHTTLSCYRVNRATIQYEK